VRYTPVVILLLLLGALSASADLAEGPDYTILWNEFTAVSMIDGFAVGIGPGAIVVCRYDDTLLSFVPINILLTEFEPVFLKRQDMLLMVRTSDDRIVFYSLHGLPQLPHLGTIDLGMPFADFVLHGEDVYISTWFEGIRRFALDDLESAKFIDSSLTGILMTQLEIHDDTLYALDRYNGIMRYDLSGPGFGQFIDYLWIPFQATSFLKTESLVIISTATRGVLFGEFGLTGSGIVDSIVGIDHPLRMFVTDTLFVFLNYRFMDLVVRHDPTQRTSLPISQNLIDGYVFILNEQYHMLLPRTDGGLTLYDLSEPGYSRSGLYPSGPISDLVLQNGKLFTGGAADPIRVYSVNTPVEPQFEYAIYDSLADVRAIDHNGDTLIVFYETLRRVFFIANSSNPDSFHIERSVFVGDTAVTDIRYCEQKIDTVRLLLGVGEMSIQVFAITDSSGIYHAGTWEFIGRITAALVYDSLLFVGTQKNQLWFYKITESFEIEFQSVKDLAGTPAKIMAIDGRLVVFVRDEMLVFDYSNPVIPELIRAITLPIPALDAVRWSDKLYTVGPSGVGIYNLDGAIPDLVEYGGRAGSFLDVEGNVLATSDGGSIHIYHLSDAAQPTLESESLASGFVLSQNYPNPFNAGTSIGYSLQTNSQVGIIVYNVLGQRVNILVDEEKPAGDYTAYWDGTDHSRGQVASGIYFYRLRVGDRVSSKKMILLK
jgi:hypothetical protein